MKTSSNDISNIELLSKIEGSNIELLSKIEVLIDSSKVETYEAIQELAQHMDEEFANVRHEMVTKDELRLELSRFATKEELASEMSKLKTTMVTKGYLDDKLADHHSDIILHTQREIAKALG